MGSVCCFLLDKFYVTCNSRYSVHNLGVYLSNITFASLNSDFLCRAVSIAKKNTVLKEDVRTEICI